MSLKARRVRILLLTKSFRHVRKYCLTVNLLHFVGFRATKISQKMKMLECHKRCFVRRTTCTFWAAMFRCFIKIQPFVTCMWQERLGKEVGKKLHAIMPQIDKKYYSGCKIRKDEIMFNRIRISHTRLIHSVSMENRPHPTLCDQYEGDHELTVKHILIECSFLKIIHRRHYDVTDLHKLFLNCIIQDNPRFCQGYMPLW